MAKAKKATIKRQSDEAIKNFLQDFGGNGHSILIPETLVKMGFDVNFVYPMIFVVNAGTHPKEMLYDNNGNSVKEIEGVYALSFAYAIANNIGVDTTKAQEKMGRGSQAGELAYAIRLVINPIEVKAKKEFIYL